MCKAEPASFCNLPGSSRSPVEGLTFLVPKPAPRFPESSSSCFDPITERIVHFQLDECGYLGRQLIWMVVSRCILRTFADKSLGLG
jgi:hypothetical protein